VPEYVAKIHLSNVCIRIVRARRYRMERNIHTTDEDGFDYMANTGKEEQDRDTCGMIMAAVIITALTLFQYLGLY
jgi:hypothetical protein